MRDNGVTQKSVVMIGTQFDTMGGISAVVNVYRQADLFERFPIIYLATHCDGGALRKVIVALLSILRFITLLFMGKVAGLHAHVSSYASFWRKAIFFFLAFLFRVPTILHLHGSEFAVFYEKDCGNKRQHLVRFVFHRVTHIVVLSQAWQRWVAGITRNPNISVIHNPVLVPEHVTPWEQRDPAALLFLGRIGQRKGCYDLISATAQVSQTYPAVNVLMGGDGNLIKISAQAKDLDCLQNVSLLGWLDSKAKQDQLARAKAYVLPSYNEGLPMSILEAMAAGIPVISTYVGGIPEAISDGVEGFLIPAGDVQALQERMQRLLSDDALALRMGEAARRKVQRHFSVEIILPKIVNLYLELGFSPIETAVQ